MKHSMLALTLLAATPLSLKSQGLTAVAVADSARRLIDVARMHGSAEGFQSAQVLLDRALTAWPEDPWLHHYKGFGLYVLAAQTLGQGGNPVPLLEQARTALERSARLRPVAETYAILSGVLGQLITDEATAMALGPEAGQAMGRARGMGPENPRVWFLDGVGAMFTPEAFGGGLAPAEEKLRRAVALFERDTPAAAPAPRWGKAEAHAWLGVVFQRTGRADLARAEFQAALLLEPENGWIRNVLVPGLDRPAR